jgi:predicted ThiF/HesA family dinucleotide-utilizing enzyme
MQQPKATEQIEVDAVVHAAVSSAMSDVAALLLAYGREGPITDDIIAHTRAQVLTTLKNSSATGLSLELQAVAFTRAVGEVTYLIDSAIARSWAAHRHRE